MLSRRTRPAPAADDSATRPRRPRVLGSSLLLPPLRRIPTLEARDKLLEAVAVALELLHEGCEVRRLRPERLELRSCRFWEDRSSPTRR